MTNLTDFLLARITEDEDAARSCADGPSGSGSPWAVAGWRHLSYDNGAGEDVVAVRVDHSAGPWERIYVKRATHVGCVNGLGMTSGCELSMRRWAR